MFEVRCGTGIKHNYYVSDGFDNYLHSDGSVLSCAEFWPTREQAQAVLDKYQPEHVWEHGDVFKRESGTVMIYIDTIGKGASVFCVDHKPYVNGGLSCTDGATFLFNIKDKLPC